MKVLLVGLGSIGKRHLSNIVELGYKDITVISRSVTSLTNLEFVQFYSSTEAVPNDKHFDAAVICTPTSQHVSDVLKITDIGIKKIYLEKPVSHSYDNFAKMLDEVKKQDVEVIIGYDLHYDLGLQKVKELLCRNKIGKVVAINAQVGQFLPSWRPGQDYRQGMSAKKQTGGGVMLDLVHEFDYLYRLFGEVETIACLYQHSKSLDIETEDVAEVLVKFKNNIIGSIHLDYLQPKLIRNCLITGAEGSISWDLATTKVRWIDHNNKETEFDYSSFSRNDRFINIMRDFLANNRNEKTTTLEQGLYSLKMVLAAKYSSENNAFVHLDNFLN